MTLVLFTIPDHPKSEEALKLVRSKLRSDDFRVRVCPSAMAREYPMPFLALEDKSPIYGLDDIKYYFSHREEFVPVLGTR